MQSQVSIRKGYVAGEFLTRTYRISGEVDLHGLPLLDQLNDINALFITLERMFISPLLDPATLTGHYPAGDVRKDTLGVVVLNQLRDGLPMREGRYIGRDHIDRQALVVVAGFEVLGSIRLHPSVNVPHFVRTTPEDFIPIFNASATLAARRSIVFEGGAILVNRKQVEVFCMTEGASQPAGQP
jgi:hypothetical protein